METTKTTTRQPALRLLAALFFLCLFAPVAAGQDNSTTPSNWKDNLGSVTKLENSGGGDGTSWTDAILIASAQELAYFAKQVNSGQSIAYGNGDKSIKYNGKGEKGFEGYYFALSADIDLKDHYWTPIGNAYYFFRGNFDGKGHCVKELKVKVESNDGTTLYVGLFGYTYAGTLRNLGVWLATEGVVIISSGNGVAYAGGIAGTATNIFNCYVTGEGEGKVKAEGFSHAVPGFYVGGIVGDVSLSGTLSDCYATVDVKAEAEDRSNYVGGIVGGSKSANVTLSRTYATGAVEAAGGSTNCAGGICGDLYAKSSTLSCNLALNSAITGGNGESGRIVGGRWGTLSNNYASTEIEVNGKFVSGGTDSDNNGDPTVYLHNFSSVFPWGDGWNTDKGTLLPQLRMRTDDGSGAPSYSDWPTGNGYTPQPSLDADEHMIAKKFADGTGDPGAPYQITSLAQLDYLARQVNGGKDYKGEHFTLENDIDVSGFSWTPIGNGEKPFKGNFDGQGHCVKGLKVSGVRHAGLFGYIDGGTIQNLGVELAPEGIMATDNENASYAGGIAGRLYSGNIHNCYVTGDGMTLTTGDGVGYAGGIVGLAYSSKITHCYATIEVKVESRFSSCAGGIAGRLTGGKISCTYSTGAIEVKDDRDSAGGICAQAQAHADVSISNNLALNSEIKGKGKYIGRIVGQANNDLNTYVTLSNSYASTKTSCSFTPADNLNGTDGAHTYLNTFVDDLKGIGWGDSWDIGDGTNLPKLKMKTDKGYVSWPDGQQQPSLAATAYLNLLVFPKLHILSPTGGTLKVTGQGGTTLSDGTDIRPGTPLTLAYTANTNYSFSGYLSGSSAGNLNPLSVNTIEMPADDLYLSAAFNYHDPTPPEPPAPVYYTVTLPVLEGATTDPAGGSYEVESWNTFRFYLTLEPDYSESQPVVTTSRGETIQPRSSDGAYLLKYVGTDVEVFIAGIVKNAPPVANEPIGVESSQPAIWSENGSLYVRLPEGLGGGATGGASFSDIRIFTPAGRLLHVFRSTPGLNRWQLPTGLYIIQVGDTVRKVLIR